MRRVSSVLGFFRFPAGNAVPVGDQRVEKESNGGTQHVPLRSAAKTSDSHRTGIQMHDNGTHATLHTIGPIANPTKPRALHANIGPEREQLQWIARQPIKHGGIGGGQRADRYLSVQMPLALNAESHFEIG